ncbi:MAG: hypothetical protein CMH50_10585 [Myxococcales bacterium]|nr:hypothetical protein [Myxococcales bacterium]MBF94637.1 hypothetical protein [Myxococcales bacterium]
MKTMYKSSLALIAAVGLISSPALARKKQKVVQVTVSGMAQIIDGNEPAAKDRALEDAQRQAVEQAMGTMLTSETLMENYQIVSDKVFAKSSGYIRKYSIIDSKPDGKNYKVTIKADVSEGDLANDVDGLRNLLTMKGMPRVFVVVTESVMGQEAFKGSAGSADFGAVELAIIERLRSQGFLLVDPDVLSGNVALESVYKSGNVSVSQARNIGKLSGADVVIFGKASVTDNGAMPGMGRGRANPVHVFLGSTNIRAVNTSNGQILATSSATAHVPGTSIGGAAPNALKKAGKSSAKQLVGGLTKTWSSESTNGVRITLTITGVKFRDVRKAKAMLSNMRGVKSVKKRSFSGKKRRVKFDVHVKTSADNFANVLDGKKLGRRALEVTELRGEVIEADLGK